MIVTTSECYPTIRKVLIQIKSTAKVVIVDKPNQSIPEETIKFSEVAESGLIDVKLLDKIEMNKKDLIFLPFSSGTTGLPKAVEINQTNVMACLEMMENERVALIQPTTGKFNYL